MRPLGFFTVFDFAPGGVSEFEVLGIDPNLGLDPTNPIAFITALTFESAGKFHRHHDAHNKECSGARLVHVARLGLAGAWFNPPEA
jgi:hypothetical protein